MSTVSVEVSKDLVQPIIEAKIQAAIVSAMGDNPEELIEALVRQALNEKVSSTGGRPEYSSDEKYTYIDWLCRDVIKEQAAKALREWVEENKEKIQDAILKHMKSQKGSAKLAAAMAEGMVRAIGCSWKFSCTIKDISDE